MKKQSRIKFFGTIIVLPAIGIGIGWLLFAGSSGNDQPNATGTVAVEESGGESSIWTCSMHPQIRQPEPGDCPICGMDLIPLAKDIGGEEGPRSMSMSDASRALAGIQTLEVVRGFPEMKAGLVGLLEYDATLEKSLTARFPARIDELYVNYTGIRVKKGDHLAKVYSPELLTAQRELLIAFRADPNSSFTRAVREKLRLWDLLPEQIEAIIESGEASDNFVLKAPIGGVVVTKQVNEGDYLKLGQPLFRIVDLSTLWAQLDAYESDLPWLRYGQDVSFTVESFPGETFHGKIAFIEPEINRKTRTVPIRVNVPNEDGRLKPGMFVRANVAARLAGDGNLYAPELVGKWISPMHPEIVKDGPGKCDVCGMDLVAAAELGFVNEATGAEPLLVPTSAVLRTGKRAVVYVEKPDMEHPTYEGREIVLGPKAGKFFIVVAGLDAGERVVTQGAFKIDSALQIQAKPSMMNPKGGGPAPGHNMDMGDKADPGSSAADPQAKEKMSGMLEIPAEQAKQLIQPYLAMQSALAGDDMEAAKAQAKAMMKVTGHNGKLPEMLHDMIAAETLDAFRMPHFEMLSNALITAAKAQPGVFSGDLSVMHCPMANDNKGADWLQATKPLQNPYFGKMMLKCGEIKETIEAKASEMKVSGRLEIPEEQAAPLIRPYLAMQSALAGDDLEAAKAQAKAMMKVTGHSGKLPEMLHDMIAAETLDAFRMPHFKMLSDALITAAKAQPGILSEDLSVMHCPMAADNKGADWLQATKPLQNPYFGKMMLKCGEIKETIGAKAVDHSEHE